MKLQKRIGKCEVELLLYCEKLFRLGATICVSPKSKIAYIDLSLVCIEFSIYLDWFPVEEYPFDITKDFGGEKE